MTLRHWIMIVLTAGLFGSSFLFIKIALADIPPMTIAAGRAGIAALIIGLFAWSTGVRLPASARDWRVLGIVGCLTAAIPYAATAAGQAWIDSSLGGILFATIPLFTVFLAPLFLADERFTLWRVTGALTGLGGVAIVMGPQAAAGLQTQMLGALITLAAAASYAAGGIFTRANPQIAPPVMATGQLIVAAPLLASLSAGIDAPWTLTPSATSLWSLGALGLVSTAFPVLLFFRLVHEVGATRTSLLTFFIPVFAVLLGTGLLGEAPGFYAFAGLALIIGGAALISRRVRTRSVHPGQTAKLPL